MMPAWLAVLIPVVGIVVGVLSGWLGAHIGIRIGIAKLEFQMDAVTAKMAALQTRSDAYNEDLLVHDIELEDVMRKLELPRKRRQNWRFS